jgi:OCT family organic cation transporter-like MFS transporter 4/5
VKKHSFNFLIDVRCFIPECDNPDSPNYEENFVEYTVPGKFSSNHFIPEQCERYELLEEFYNETESCPAHWFSSNSIRCNKWVFDEHEHTIVEDWNLTCVENNWKLALVGTMHFAGIASGSAVFGLFADKYGRKRIFIVAIFFMSVTGIGQALSGNYITFLVFAFLNAVGTSGVFPLAFIIGVEMVGKHKREMSGIILNYFYAIGEAFVGIISWLNGDWIVLQYLVSAPPIIFVSYYW